MTPRLVTIVTLQGLVECNRAKLPNAIRGRLPLDGSDHTIGASVRWTAVAMRPDAISAGEWDTLRRSLGWSLPQTEIMRRLFAGKSYQEIACEMAIRPRTVRTTVNRLYRQFGVSDRAQLVLHVLTVLREHWEAGKEYPFTGKGETGDRHGSHHGGRWSPRFMVS